jgi:hypothetical protein
VEDFDVLASSLAAGVSDVRGCLFLSKDGLVLGSHPESGEVEAKHAWVRFAALGDPERGFAQFGAETWCYVRRGPYAAFAIVGPGARPGLAIDHMEQVLLSAQESRNRPPTAREPAPAGPAPTTRPRSSLHPEGRSAAEPVLITTDTPVPVSTQSGRAEPPPVPAPPAGPADGPGAGPPTRPDGAGGEEGRESDVDRFSLAREFGQLLQDDEAVADG